MSARRAEKVRRRAKRKEKKRAWDLNQRINDSIKVLQVVAEAGGTYTDEDRIAVLNPEGYRALKLPKGALYRELREGLLSRRR